MRQKQKHYPQMELPCNNLTSEGLDFVCSLSSNTVILPFFKMFTYSTEIIYTWGTHKHTFWLRWIPSNANDFINCA